MATNNNNRSISMNPTAPISKAQGILISQMLSFIPPSKPEVRGARGFAIQAATKADVNVFIPGWPSEGVTMVLASTIIDELMKGKRQNNPAEAVGVAAWLDGLAERGVGMEATTAHQAVKAAKVAPTTIKAAALSALDRMRARAAQEAGIAPAPVAPAAPAVDIGAIVAAAVAAAMSQVAEANAKVIADLMERNVALMNAATEAKTEAATAQAETVTVAKGAKGQATK